MKHLLQTIREFLDHPGASLEGLLDDLVGHLREREASRPPEAGDVGSKAGPESAAEDPPGDSNGADDRLGPA